MTTSRAQCRFAKRFLILLLHVRSTIGAMTSELHGQRELQMLTNDYGMSRENLLKSEALLTLALKVHFEAHSAPTLHRKSTNGRSSFCVGALCAEAPVPIRPVKWPLSRPNCALHRSRLPEYSLSSDRNAMAVPSISASPGAPVSLVRWAAIERAR